MKPYHLEIVIHGLPKTTNANVGHWTTRASEAKLWKRRVQAMVLVSDVREPKFPLKKARLTLIRYSSGSCDFDGLVSSFKHCIDGLISAGVLDNDKFENIGAPTYIQEKVARGKGKIKIIVDELVAGSVRLSSAEARGRPDATR